MLREAEGCSGCPRLPKDAECPAQPCPVPPPWALREEDAAATAGCDGTGCQDRHCKHRSAAPHQRYREKTSLLLVTEPRAFELLPPQGAES